MARTVPAVQRAFAILEMLTGERAELRAPEIVDELRLPRTTVHELVNTLVSLGYLETSPIRPGVYRLGQKLVGLGMTYVDRLDLAVEGRKVAEQIVRECSETVHVAALDGRDAVYLVKVDSTRAVRMVSAQGRRLPAHCTAVGKMLLAQLPDAEVDALYRDADLESLTPNSITDMGQLRATLDEVRRAGVAFDREESTLEVSCVSAPVYDHNANVVAAMSVSIPVTRWDERGDEGWAALVRDGADRLSRQLGKQG